MKIFDGAKNTGNTQMLGDGWKDRGREERMEGRRDEGMKGGRKGKRRRREKGWIEGRKDAQMGT